MKKLLILLSLSALTFSACVTGPVADQPDELDDGDEEEMTVPEEVEDEYNINLDNALIELEIVDQSE